MARVNHRGWIVLESITSADGLFCVDFFRRPDGTFGFGHLRLDPEDGGRWTAVGGIDSMVYGSAVEAGEAAARAVPWLTAEPRARRLFRAWPDDRRGASGVPADGRVVDAAVFDLDGVIRHFDPGFARSIEERHSLDAGSLSRAAFEPELLLALTTGRITRREWSSMIGDAVGAPAAGADFITSIGTVDADMIGIVGQLRRQGITAVILTNGTDTIPAELETLGIGDCFDAVFNSAEIGIVKPDPAVYEFVLEQLDLIADRVFFTDDRKENVVAAAQLGMHAHHFQGVDGLRASLADLGIDCF